VRFRTLTSAAIVAAALVLVPAAPAGAHPPAFPTTLDLPVGFRPEGIAIGPGPFAYFGSLADGRILRVNLATGDSRVVSDPLVPARPSVGLKSDQRSRLYVAGGNAGTGRVVDIRSGKVLTEYQFATGTVGERGYWQINPVNGALSTYGALGNAHAAVVMSGNGANWSPWTTFTSGAYAGRC